MKQKTAAAPTTPPDATGAGLVRGLIDALNARDMRAARRAWTSETVVHYPDRVCHGADEIAAYFADSFAALPDWHMEVVADAERGENVFVRWRLTGTHRGSLAGVAATGRALEIAGIDNVVVRDGRVVSNFVVFDQLDSARQIGMMPAAESLAESAMKRAFNARTRLTRGPRRR